MHWKFTTCWYKFFWVKDRVDKKEVEIKYFPTTLMLADYYTKPLQGNVFRRFRDVIMGYTHINNLLLDPTLLLKERVEKSNNIVIKNVGLNIIKKQVTYAGAVRANQNIIREKQSREKKAIGKMMKCDRKMSVLSHAH